MADKDHWSTWLAERRHGGDEQARRDIFENLLVPLRDRVLDGCGPIAERRVLDVGCGDGLIAFGALNRGAAHVVFSDVSRDLLDQVRELADESGVIERCSFVECSAEDLAPVPSQSVDLVTLRSVLIYVRRKAEAFREFARVLRPDGRLSMFEPINRFGQPEWTAGRFFGVDVAPLGDLWSKVNEVYGRAVPASDPMLDFDERNLFAWAEAAGFSSIGLELSAELRAANPQRWEVFVHSAGNPNLPTLAEAMDAALTGSERERVVAYLKPLIESGRGVRRIAHAYLTAAR